jgi:Predicted membrane GTPase involved in stress response
VQTILETVPPPTYDPDFPLQALVTNLDADSYVGRLALCRIRHGTLRKGATVPGAAPTGRSRTRASPSSTSPRR